MPLKVIGGVALLATLLCCFLSVRAIWLAVSHIGLGGLIRAGGFAYLAAVCSIALLMPGNRSNVAHWRASSDIVVTEGAYGLRWLGNALWNMPESILFAITGQRQPLLLSRHPEVSADQRADPTPEPSRATVVGPIAVGLRVYVTGTQGTTLRIRVSPASTASIVARADPGQMFDVIDGPVYADDRVWWKVRSSTVEGWTTADYLAVAKR